MKQSNVTVNTKEWLGRNWAWLLFAGCTVLLTQIDQDIRAPLFVPLFILPLGIMIWYYWNRSYDSKFQDIETEKKYIDNRVHHLRTEKQGATNFFMLLQDCDTDYKILELKKKNLKNQKERDVSLCICIIMLIMLFVLPFSIGILGWNNIIEILS